jgi:hypothetical protein
LDRDSALLSINTIEAQPGTKNGLGWERGFQWLADFVSRRSMGREFHAVRALGPVKPCSRPINFPPPVPFPQASISPTHAAPQHRKTHLDQHVKPCWKNRPTLKLWRESPDSERKSPTIPPSHHQGFWRKARKYSGISKPTQG